MIDSSDPFVLRILYRINLRLAPGIFKAIDEARSARPGHVSRNTWLTEAVQEKLVRETANTTTPNEDLRHHG